MIISARSGQWLLAVACLCAAPLCAGQGRDWGQYNGANRGENANAPVNSVEQATHEVERRYPGSRVLRATTEQEGGNSMYEIRVLTPNGRVRNISVDPGTGHLSE